MGKPTGVTGARQELRKCATLSPQQADDLFFPGVGCKVAKAKKFCSTCPVINECLQDALKFNLDGFWAGTTFNERRSMKDFIGSLPLDVLDFLPRSVREREEGKKVVGRRPPQPVPNRPPTYRPLDDMEGPTEEELKMLA